MKTTLLSLYIFNTTKTNTTFDEVKKHLDISTDWKSSNSSCMIQRDNLRWGLRTWKCLLSKTIFMIRWDRSQISAETHSESSVWFPTASSDLDISPDIEQIWLILLSMKYRTVVMYMEIGCFVCCLCGWILVCSTLPTEYWTFSEVGSIVLTTSNYYSNLWKDCISDTTGVSDCKDYPSLLALPGRLLWKPQNELNPQETRRFRACAKYTGVGKGLKMYFITKKDQPELNQYFLWTWTKCWRLQSLLKVAL